MKRHARPKHSRGAHYNGRRIFTMRFLASWRAVTVLAISLVAVGSIAVLTSPEASAERSIPVNVRDFGVQGSDPWGTAFDSSGRVWVAMPGCDPSPYCSSGTPPGKLGLFNPATHNWVATVQLPSGYGQPLFVAVDRSGEVWFTMPVTNAIGVYNPSSSTLREWTVPTANSGPWDLAIDSTGKIWFTEHYVNQIGSFDPATGSFFEIATPATNSNPYGIAVDASNNIWFTENNAAVGLIGEYTSGGVLNEYKIRSTPVTGLTPHLITIDQAGNIWWSEGFVGAIAKLDLASATPGTNDGVTEYFYGVNCGPSCSGTHTSGIAASRQGRIWFDDSLQNVFGSMPIGGGPFSIYSAPSDLGTNPHPHDGLNVDSDGRVWFDEEFTNGLAEAIPPTGRQG
jgi:streptogramin lyase